MKTLRVAIRRGDGCQSAPEVPGLSPGFSVIELLVVLVVIGILSVAGILALGSSGSAATRTLLDDLEGTLLSAAKLSVATSQDVTLSAQGNWDPAAATTLSLCRATGLSLSTAQINAQLGLPETFKVGLVAGGTALDRQSQTGGVAAAAGTGSTWWATAMGPDPVTGLTNQDITSVQPFSTQTGFQGLLSANPSQNLFQGGSNPNQVNISGLSKRFMNTFFIQIVGLAGGQPYPGSPMGLLVVLNNGGTVYKFYNPGVKHGNGKWRRI